MHPILSPAQRLDGPTVIWSWTRPRKLAYFLDEQDVNSAVHAIGISCVSWGGASFLFVPTTKGEITDEWTEIVLRYDPDLFVDTSGLVGTLPSQLRDLGIPVRTDLAGDPPTNVPGALLYAVLAAHLPQKRKEGVHALVPQWPEDSDLALPFAAKWGVIREEGLGEALKWQGLSQTIRLRDLVGLTPVDLLDTIDALTRADPVGEEPYPDNRSLLSLPELTLVGVPEWFAPRPIFAPADPEGERLNRQHTRRIIVTGRPSSIADFCLYWSLRASRPDKRDPLPLWIPLSRLAGADALSTIQATLRSAHSRAERDDLYVLSASATREEIEETFHPSGSYHVITERFSDFFPAVVRVGERRTEVVTFAQGRAHIPRSPDPKLERLGDGEAIAQEIEISGFRLPQIASLRRDIFGNAWRITRTGLENMYYPAQGEQPANITLPDSWRVLEAIFEDAGYGCSPSDKGRFAVGIVELIGGAEKLAVFASSLVYGLVESMAERQGRREIQRAVERLSDAVGPEFLDDVRKALSELAPNQELRNAFGFSQFVTALKSRDSATRVMNWLLTHSLVHRGADLVCPRCGLRR